MGQRFEFIGEDPRTAIYLIGDDPKGPTKIGISRDPIKRLSQMQVGYPKRLFLYGIYWVRSRQIAEAIEKWLLETWCQNHRLEGEWVSKSPRILSPAIVGLISTHFGYEVLLEWEEHFVHRVTEALYPELAFADPNQPTPEEFGYEHAFGQLGFGS
jgi:hypothetical protein